MFSDLHDDNLCHKLVLSKFKFRRDANLHYTSLTFSSLSREISLNMRSWRDFTTSNKEIVFVCMHYPKFREIPH